VQRIADAALHGRPSLDWDVVVGELRRHRLSVPAADALAGGYLRVARLALERRRGRVRDTDGTAP
jgi:hypothetical protein